jgi:hypothetical protein
VDVGTAVCVQPGDATHDIVRRCAVLLCVSFSIRRRRSSEPCWCVAAKGEFIRDQGMLGFAMWEAGGDYNDILLDSITAAAKCGS